MEGSRNALAFVWVLAVGACADSEFDGRFGDTAALTARRQDSGIEVLAAPPAGYRFAVNGTHVERCTGTKCSTMWSDDPLKSPNNCGGGFVPAESYIVRQRGADWDGIEGEAELHGDEYRLAARIDPASTDPAVQTLPTLHNQSVILQCCPAVGAARPQRPGAFIDMKACPDPCDAPDGRCPITLASGTDTQTFGACKTSQPVWLIDTDRCDLVIVDAAWRDPHAPHDLANPSGGDKDVYDVYYRAAWTCGDGFCDTDETGASCPDDCGP